MPFLKLYQEVFPQSGSGQDASLKGGCPKRLGSRIDTEKRKIS